MGSAREDQEGNILFRKIFKFIDNSVTMNGSSNETKEREESGMSKRIRVKQLNEHIYLMDDNHESTGYLVIGEEQALVIDTMNGKEDVKAVVREITDLPLTVVNTHGHPDHIYGNIFFEKAYMHPEDLPVAERFIKEPEFISDCQKRNLHMPEFLPIYPGEVIDLGGIKLEVIGLPGHTPGGICLFLRKDRIMFTGDSMNGHTWMQGPESLPMNRFLDNLNALEPMWNEVDYILTGHSQGLEDASAMLALRDAVAELCAGKTENDISYQWFGGVCRAHPYGDGSKLILYQEPLEMEGEITL